MHLYGDLHPYFVLVARKELVEGAAAPAPHCVAGLRGEGSCVLLAPIRYSCRRLSKKTRKIPAAAIRAPLHSLIGPVPCLPMPVTRGCLGLSASSCCSSCSFCLFVAHDVNFVYLSNLILLLLYRGTKDGRYAYMHTEATPPVRAVRP